ncbi:MAG: hypothetical protein HOC77_12785, partial [Chloroflexi bacterium]|nr:hypothetical protein [Chloroflexota bacterium]
MSDTSNDSAGEPSNTSDQPESGGSGQRPVPSGGADSVPRAAATGTAASSERGMFYGWWIVIASVFSNGTGGAIHWQ